MNCRTFSARACGHRPQLFIDYRISDGIELLPDTCYASAPRVRPFLRFVVFCLSRRPHRSPADKKFSTVSATHSPSAMFYSFQISVMHVCNLGVFFPLLLVLVLFLFFFIIFLFFFFNVFSLSLSFPYPVYIPSRGIIKIHPRFFTGDVIRNDNKPGPNKSSNLWI